MPPRRPMTVSDSIVIATDPMAIYEWVSDPRRTGEWSPENTGARFDGDSLAVGSSFVGSNKRGVFRWVTRCVVTHAEPGRRFTFRVQQIGARTPRLKAPIATWDYQLEPDGSGTRVTETWTDLRANWPDAAARAFDFVVLRGSTFAAFQARNIATSLKNLQRTLEV